MNEIFIEGAREHNLKNLTLRIPRNAITVVTGLSGSGKSSLAFDTLYAEGQRRYIESLSTYARQFLEQMEKPDVDIIEGLSPAISIEQKTTSQNARSTVGTITEIYDYLRLLFSSAGIPHCPRCRRPISRQSLDQIVQRVFEIPHDSRIMILAPVVRQRKGEFRKLFEKFHSKGFLKARVDGSLVSLEDPPRLVKQKNHTVEIVIDRLLVRPELRQRVEDSVRYALGAAEGLVTISIVGGEEFLFSEKMACVDCGINLAALEPRNFSFNSKFGACPECDGLGSRPTVHLQRLVLNPDQPLAGVELALKNRELKLLFRESVSALLRHFGIEPSTPFDQYLPQVHAAIRQGLPEELEFRYAGHVYRAQFEGLDRWFQQKIDSTGSGKRRQQLSSFLKVAPCALCGGSRLRAESRSVRVAGHSISEYCKLPIDECFAAIRKIRLSEREDRVAGPVLEEIRRRLSFLLEVGLEYLTLDRQALSLSAGEAQRVRLATQVGSQLRGVLYVLDEPSIGLHARDTHRLLKSLAKLRDLGNTIIVVEHDEETIRAADHIVDLGPGAGRHGGELVTQGTLNEVVKSERSLTAAYLTGRLRIVRPPVGERDETEWLRLHGVTHHNLRNIDVAFPLRRLITVTGVSGAGKSSLVDEVLFRALSRSLYRSLAEPGPYRELVGAEQIDKVIEIDQSPIGRTPRSNPATYSGVFTPIRELFAALPESKMRGYKAGRFSFNVKGGRCEQCQGDGTRKIEMNFLPDVYVLCEACQGSRYNRETLSVKYQGHTIADVLNLTVEEAFQLLENIPRIAGKLKTLMQVGLGYITLGQSSTTLSGGEAQRVKLARELSRRSTGNTLYILDEPTTGLHFEDVRKLLDILFELVNLGNTVIIIEHNLDIIRCADWIIDLGPEGGRAGGKVVSAGPPETVARCRNSHTGRALRNLSRSA